MPEPSALLTLSLILPLFGMGLVWAVAPRGRRWVRQTALITSLLTLVLSLVLAFSFPGGEAPFALINIPWLGANSGLTVDLHLGLDGLSVWLFALSALLISTSVLVSWEAIEDRAAGFCALLLLLEVGLLGVFAARDVILFYIFFEFTLIPLFLLIGIWGSEQRRYAAAKFFIYTLAGSLLTFLGLLTLYFQSDLRTLSAAELRASGIVRQNVAGEEFTDRVAEIQHSRRPQHTFNIPALTLALQKQPLSLQLQLWVFLALLAGFAIKVPLFPLHTWLPLAHVQAPTAGSVLLAGVLLKIGTYGFARFSIPMLPQATVACMPYLLWLSVAGIIYGALVALAQSDIKRLIAYSSVSHLGYCTLGLFALNRLGMQGGTLQMINHGLSTGGLFACVGIIYERYHTRQIDSLGNLARTMPTLAFFMAVFMLSSIGLPGLNGFAGEFLVLLGMFQRGWAAPLPGWESQMLAIAVLACLGVVLGAWYMLWLYQRTFFSPLKHAGHQAQGDQPHGEIKDLSLREILALAPLLVPIVWIGVQPAFFLERMAPTLNRIVASVPVDMAAPGDETEVAVETEVAGRPQPERRERAAKLAQTPRQQDRPVVPGGLSQPPAAARGQLPGGPQPEESTP